MVKVCPADAKLPPGWYAKHALEEAKRGDPGHLIGRLLNRRRLTDDEIQFIVDVLEKTGGKRQDDQLREIEQFLIASQVEDLMKDGTKKEAAITEVMRWRERSRRHVFNALKAYRGKSRRG